MITQIYLTQAPTPRSLTLTAASAAALQTAIDAQTNTLNKTQRTPVQSANQTAAPTPQAPNPIPGTITYYTSGAVMNNSIVVSETRVFVANDVPTYFATVLWMEWVTPS